MITKYEPVNPVLTYQISQFPRIFALGIAPAVGQWLLRPFSEQYVALQANGYGGMEDFTPLEMSVILAIYQTYGYMTWDGLQPIYQAYFKLLNEAQE